eukprot:TRINITY_DN5746_c0_g1_i1.p1 TRINITY_DN5746_c0_g1~~TRINITY_DN5746_c0_g1_i1.p1  ORF type:complete len:351 (+),score=30.91 TRINITY_DN5746_c0_g1_i1:260-1312(+)
MELLLQKYHIIRQIGQGGFSVLHLVKSLADQSFYAAKQISKSCPGLTSHLIECEVLQKISQYPHPNLARFVELIEDDEELFIIMEYLPGGDLLEYLMKHEEALPEAQVKKIFCSLISAVNHLHQLGIVHRDLKLENVLIDTHGDVRLVDFNLSSKWSPGKVQTNHCGSLIYCAPEMLTRAPYFGPEADVWSLGVMLYAMVFRQFPFNSPGGEKKDPHTIGKKIITASYTFPVDILAQSESIYHLIDWILRVDGMSRPTTDQILTHPWMSGSPAAVKQRLILESKSVDEMRPRKSSFSSTVTANPKEKFDKAAAREKFTSKRVSSYYGTKAKFDHSKRLFKNIVERIKHSV